MGFYDCMSAVTTALGRRPSMDEFDALYERLLAEKDGLFKRGYPDDWLAASQSIARQFENDKRRMQHDVIRNKKVHGEATAFITAARAQVDAGLALKALLVGINKPIEGGRASIAVHQNGIKMTAIGSLLADLRRQADNGNHLVNLFSTPGYELEIAKALRGEPAAPDAVKIGEAINRAREDLRRQENEAGGFRGKMDGYITKQSHDSLSVRRAGFEKWRDYIMPMLDPKTFDRQEDVKTAIAKERGQVLQHQLETRRELMAIEQALTINAKLEKRATERAGRADTLIEGLRQDFSHLVGRYLSVIDQPTPERAMLRTEVERVRFKIGELARKSKDAMAAVPGLIDSWNATLELSDRTSRAIELFDELQAKMLGYDKRLKGAIDPENYLQGIYNNIAADTWMRGEQQDFHGLLKYMGPANLARQRAVQRELHFRTAEDAVKYMKDFGVGGVSDSIIREIQSAANTIALYRMLGTNPEAMFKRLLNDLLLEAKARGDNALAAAVSRNSLTWYLDEVTGKAQSTANPTLAANATAVRSLIGMARLGGAMISSFSDIATAAAEMQYNGRGALSSYADTLAGFMRGRRSGERRIILDLLGVGFDNLVGHIMSRVGGESAPPGMIAKMSGLFFRLNGLNFWTDAHKATAGEMVSRMFALVQGQAYHELDRPLRTRLGQYGIKAADWDIIRQAAVHADDRGTTFLTPEGIKQIPLGLLMTYGPFATEADRLAAERAARVWRDRIAAGYASLVVDRVDHAIVTPGAEERALATMGTQRGDVLGEALRFVMQFKSFPIAMTTRFVGRVIHGSEDGGKLSATARLAWMALQLSAFGYLSASVKDMLAGKNPRDPLAPETWVAALTQGGGLGIMGDFAFGEFNRFGRSALSTAAGPTFGLADDLLHLYAMARDPDVIERGTWGRNVAASSLRMIVSNTPYASLWWLRPALNYLAIYPVQEAISPGHLHRMEKRIERENKQTFWLRPSTEAPRL